MNKYRVSPGQRLKLRQWNPNDTGDFKTSDDAKEETEHLKKKIDALQSKLYAEGRQSLLIVLQGIDTSGKDGTIRHVLSGINPQGCQVTSFKTPTVVENNHDFLWRIHAACPPLGHIGVFNRSHYEDVLITRVHGLISDKEARQRFKEILNFEEMLTSNGTQIVKFFLHISKEEQKKRFLSRIDDPDKHWKFEEEDLKEREYWTAYRQAFECAMSATSTKDAPWYVVPSDHKWYRNVLVAGIIAHTLKKMHPRPPEPAHMNWKKLRKEVLKS